jgi:hypothetical protein
MSTHWAWCPPEVHTNPGRLCSAGSERHPVPRRPRSYAALRLPAPISHGSASPCPWLTSMQALVLCPSSGRRHVRPQTCRASETGHRCSATPGWVEERRGPPRLRDRPLPMCHGRTPRRRHPPPRPDDTYAQGCCGLQGNQDPRPPGRLSVSGPPAPWPTCSHAYASPTSLLESSPGLLPAQAGSPLAGRVLHPLDDRRSFLKLSHPHSPSTRIAWSHWYS